MLKMKDKPILISTTYKDGSKESVVWCPFWGKKPDLEKAKAEGKLLETNNYYEIHENIT